MFAVASLCAAACADSAVEPADAGVDRALLTPEVAAQLDARGFFPEQTPEPGYLRQRTRADADSLARRFIAERGVEHLASWRAQRGAAISLADLRRCSPIRYASSAYEMPLTAQSVPSRQVVAGRYILLFCGADARPALRVEVPVEPALAGAHDTHDLARLWVTGVPVEHEAHALISPEEAARVAAVRTGRRVAAVPELVNARFGYGWSRWLVRLDSAVVVEGRVTAEVDTLSFVMVGPYIDDFGTFVPLLALRPRLRATLGTHLDTLSGVVSITPDVYTVRSGMPRGHEPFYRLLWFAQ